MQLGLSVIGFAFDFDFPGFGNRRSRRLLSRGSDPSVAGRRNLLGISDFFSFLAAGSFAEALEALYDAVKNLISDIITAFANMPGMCYQ